MWIACCHYGTKAHGTGVHHTLGAHYNMGSPKAWLDLRPNTVTARRVFDGPPVDVKLLHCCRVPTL
jgi:hypothetical protein